jgi:hypothetical protein
MEGSSKMDFTWIVCKDSGRIWKQIPGQSLLKDIRWCSTGCPKSLEPMGILIIGSMTCFLIDGLGGEAQWIGHQNHLTLTPWNLHFRDS